MNWASYIINSKPLSQGIYVNEGMFRKKEFKITQWRKLSAEANSWLEVIFSVFPQSYFLCGERLNKSQRAHDRINHANAIKLFKLKDWCSEILWIGKVSRRMVCPEKIWIFHTASVKLFLVHLFHLAVSRFVLLFNKLVF